MSPGHSTTEAVQAYRGLDDEAVDILLERLKVLEDD